MLAVGLGQIIYLCAPDSYQQHEDNDNCSFIGVAVKTESIYGVLKAVVTMLKMHMSSYNYYSITMHRNIT